MRKVSRRLRVMLRLHVPLRSPVKICAFHPSQCPQFFGAFHIVEKRQYFAEFIRGVRRNPFSTVFLVETLQAFVSEVAYFHELTVARSLTLVK